MTDFVDVFVGRDNHHVLAWATYRGQFYAALVVLPPFVAESADAYLSTVEIAGHKASRAVHAMLAKVLGIPCVYLPPEFSHAS